MADTALRVVCRGALCVVLPHPRNAYWPYALRHAPLAFFSALFVALTIGATLVISLTPEVARLSTITSATIVRLTNAERVKAGVPALKEVASLSRSARLKGEHMLRLDYFEHTSPDGLTPWVWFDRANYPYVYAGENLAIDFTEAEDVIAAWVRSESHRRNLLSDRYEEIGIAVVTGEFQGRQATVVVQHFGARRALPKPATPAPSPAVAEATTPAPTPLPAPTVREPRSGAVIGGKSVVVRGTAPPGSSVRIALDAKVVATSPARGETFEATIPLPAAEERDATLTAVAVKDGQESAAAETPVRLDTAAPSLTTAGALLLPDPLGNPGMALLALPLSGETVEIVVELPGQPPLPLRREGPLGVARFALPSSPGASESVIPLRVSDALGNTAVTVLPSPFRYATAAPTEEAPRSRIAAAVHRVRPALTSLLALLAGLLGINIVAHLRLHRLLHADLLAHALFVVGLGTTLLLFA